MIVKQLEKFEIRDKNGVLAPRVHLASICDQISMSEMKKVELRTAVSELLTNMLRYAGGGVAVFEQVEHMGRLGVRVIVEDQGPGIEDTKAALTPGFSTGKSLGQGLPACKNLVDFFDLSSQLGKGTKIVITKWC